MSYDPFGKDDSATLEAELRQALQHRDAALERAEEAGRELEQTLQRAKEVLARVKRANQEHGAQRVP